jgi:hypothetical protein
MVPSRNMQSIYAAAAVTSSLAVGGFSLALRRWRVPANEHLVWLAALISLPLQPLAFYLVRLPLDGVLAAQLGSSAAYAWIVTLYAPLTEEPFKLVPLLVPAIFRDIRRENVLRYALALGVGFAIGEMWFIAERVARDSTLSALPLHQWGGYVTERLMTCVFHSAFVSVSLCFLPRRIAVGLAGAVALHWLGNFPVFLMAWNVGGFGKTFWAVAVMLFLIMYLVAAIAWLSFLVFGRVAPMRGVYGLRHCPECSADYDPPLVALNLFRIRYERCPRCLKWHWTKPKSA